MKLQCLIVDDEPPALDVLESYINAVETVELAGRCENAIQAFQVLQQKKVDLIFLDIKMPQLLGTDFVRSLRNPPPIIFTTAYRDYALEGYELDIVDYLLKPIPLDRFLRAVGKVIYPSISPTAQATVSSVPYLPNKDAFLYFRTDRKSVKVFVREILYVESLKDYVRIVTVVGHPLVVKQSISSLLDLLPPDQFVRIHRSYIVAIDHVKSYTSQHIEIAGQELPVGGLYQKDVPRALLIERNR
jgi:DNA-binding LytR/AlgR family response regulator